MGRTNPTFRDYLRRFEEDHQPYRRALRRQHQEDFDRLLERASKHSSAAGQQNSKDPDHTILLSMLLSQERELQRLQAEVEDLKDE